MQYVKVITTEDGGSRFVDVDLEQIEAPYTENVPPLLVSEPILSQALVFVTTPGDLHATDPHPPPQRQFTIVLAGEFEIETTDGERRVFGPGSVVLVEDTAGRGHVTRMPSGSATFAAVPLGD